MLLAKEIINPRNNYSWKFQSSKIFYIVGLRTSMNSGDMGNLHEKNQSAGGRHCLLILHINDIRVCQ